MPISCPCTIASQESVEGLTALAQDTAWLTSAVADRAALSTSKVGCLCAFVISYFPRDCIPLLL